MDMFVLVLCNLKGPLVQKWYDKGVLRVYERQNRWQHGLMRMIFS